MKILVINGHPDKESYCQAIFQTIEKILIQGTMSLKSSILMKRTLILSFATAIENVWKKILLSFVLRN